MFDLFRKWKKVRSNLTPFTRLSLSNPLNSEIRLGRKKLKREALRIIKDKKIDDHLFTLFEELKTFSVIPKNSLFKAWQYPFLAIEDTTIRVVEAETGGVVMKFIKARLLDHKICLGFGVFPKGESDFRYSTNALHLSINDKNYIAATYTIKFLEDGRNWRMIDVEEFHNLEEAEPLLRTFSDLVMQHRLDNQLAMEEEQLTKIQKKFTL